MDISLADLQAEVTRALADWPFILDIEAANGIPRGILLAVGSRETNLTNEVGDGGHGHGVWQYDDRSHQIPAGFDSDVHAQAFTAGAMLHGLFEHYPTNWVAAVAAYNAGVGNVDAGIADHNNPDYYTTGGHYGMDVLERLRALQPWLPTTTDEDDMAKLVRTPAGAIYIQTATGKGHLSPAMLRAHIKAGIVGPSSIQLSDAEANDLLALPNLPGYPT